MLWKADLGNGTYQNPILYVDYSDPDAIRVGETYYMTASSFCNVPGLPVLTSKDLVNWEPVGYALKKIPEFRYREPIHGCGVWAPSIRYHEGLFFICFPMPDEGLYMVTSADPAGEWSTPVKIYDGAGLIDPCPFWDDDGKAYLVCGVAKSRIGYKSVLHMFEMRPDGKALLSGPVKIYDGTADKNTTTEGPKLYKRNGYYYIFAPAGGVKTGWQIVLRSRQIYGPYEVRTVMKQGKTGINGPHQGAWVTDTEGKDWFLHFQDVFAAGRITHLQPMRWTEDDWPIIGKEADDTPGIGEPVLTWEKPCGSGKCSDGISGDAVTRERADNLMQVFGLTDGDKNPAFPWQWNANPQDLWLSLSPKEGTLCLTPVRFSKERPLCDYPNLLLRKWEAPEFKACVTLTCSELTKGNLAGVMALGTTYGGLGIFLGTDGPKLIRIKGEQIFDGGAVYAREDRETSKIPKMPESIAFELEVIPENDVTAVSPKEEYTEGDEGKVLHPESVIRIRAYGQNGEKLDELRFPAKAGRWVGNKYGLFAADLGDDVTGGKAGAAVFHDFSVF